MSRKRSLEQSSMPFDQVDTSLQDDLYDVLYKTGNSSHIHSAWEMFNKPFQLESILKGFESRIADLLESFSDGTNFGFLDGFIHLNDVIIISNITKSSASRRYQTLGDEHKRLVRECKYHPGQQCKMIQQDIGFLLYLTWTQVSGAEEEEDSKDTTLEYEAETLMEVEDEGSTFKANEEMELVKKFDTALFKSETITKVEDESVLYDSDTDELNSLQLLPTFPTYCFDGKEYLLLSDIQYLYEMREDFCLAVLAKWGQLDKDFVDSSPSALALLNTKGDDFLDKEQASFLCASAFEEYEEQGLPTEEEFRLIQERLGIADMGLEGTNTLNELDPKDEAKGSIDLYSNVLYELDEEPQVNL